MYNIPFKPLVGLKTWDTVPREASCASSAQTGGRQGLVKHGAIICRGFEGLPQHEMSAASGQPPEPRAMGRVR